MKNKISFILILIIIVFVACSKYEQNDFITFRSAQNRLVGTWECTTHPGMYVFTFEKTGNATQVITNPDYPYDQVTIKGTWEFSDDKETLYCYWEDFSSTFNICKLTNNDMWFRCSNPVKYKKI